MDKECLKLVEIVTKLQSCKIITPSSRPTRPSGAGSNKTRLWAPQRKLINYLWTSSTKTANYPSSSEIFECNFCWSQEILTEKKWPLWVTEEQDSKVLNSIARNIKWSILSTGPPRRNCYCNFTLFLVRLRLVRIALVSSWTHLNAFQNIFPSDKFIFICIAGQTHASCNL